MGISRYRALARVVRKRLRVTGCRCDYGELADEWQYELHLHRRRLGHRGVTLAGVRKALKFDEIIPNRSLSEHGF